MTPVAWLALAILTSWRAARAITQEDGPWDVFSHLQEWVGGSKNWIGRGLGCPLCTGVYVALAITIIAAPLLGVTEWRHFVLYWGGISGGAAIIQKVVG